jgi:hypothetical protein
MAVVPGFYIEERYSTNDWLSVFAAHRGKTMVALNLSSGRTYGSSTSDFQFFGSVLHTMSVALIAFSGVICLLGVILGLLCIVSSIREWRTDYPDINETIEQVRSRSVPLAAV